MKQNLKSGDPLVVREERRHLKRAQGGSEMADSAGYRSPHPADL